MKVSVLKLECGQGQNRTERAEMEVGSEPSVRVAEGGEVPQREECETRRQLSEIAMLETRVPLRRRKVQPWRRITQA